MAERFALQRQIRRAAASVTGHHRQAPGLAYTRVIRAPQALTTSLANAASAPEARGPRPDD
jgi:hypothetical protein